MFFPYFRYKKIYQQKLVNLFLVRNAKYCQQGIASYLYSNQTDLSSFLHKVAIRLYKTKNRTDHASIVLAKSRILIGPQIKGRTYQTLLKEATQRTQSKRRFSIVKDESFLQRSPLPSQVSSQLNVLAERRTGTQVILIIKHLDRHLLPQQPFRFQSCCFAFLLRAHRTYTPTRSTLVSTNNSQRAKDTRARNFWDTPREGCADSLFFTSRFFFF